MKQHAHDALNRSLKGARMPFQVETNTGELVTVEKGYDGLEIVLVADDGRKFKPEETGDKVVEIDPDVVDPETGEGGTVEEMGGPEDEAGDPDDDATGGDPADATDGTEAPQD